MKIENIPITKNQLFGNEWQDFLGTLKMLEVGQSFLVRLTSNHRNAISVAGLMLDRQFVSKKDKRGDVLSRVGRIA